MRCTVVRWAVSSVALACAVTLVYPSMAGATDAARWPLREAAPVVVGYGDTFAGANGAANTHRGVDIEAEAGEAVLACADGTVSFAGRVPSAAGGTVLAVTIEQADGRKLTVMPLEAVCVSAGDVVTLGEEVGTLAGAGDVSYAEPHVHVSLRSGEAYLDPMSLLVAPAVATPPPSGPGPSEFTEPVGEAPPPVSFAPALTAVTPAVPAAGGAATAQPATPASSATLQTGAVVHGASRAVSAASPSETSAARAGAAGAKQTSAGLAEVRASALGAQSAGAQAHAAARSGAAASVPEIARAVYSAASDGAIVRRALAQLRRSLRSVAATWACALFLLLLGVAALVPLSRRDACRFEPGDVSPRGEDIAALAGR